MGMDAKNLRNRYPEIATAHDLYLDGRSQQLVSVEIPKGKGSSLRIVSYTTGFGSLPNAGGLLDQPYRLMEFWSRFLEGDRSVTIKTLS